MPNLPLAFANHERLRAELIGRWPEISSDPEALEDTLEGLSDLPDAVAGVIRSALQDEADCETLTAQIKRLQDRRSRLEVRAERKRAMALHYCQEGQLPRISRPDFTASVSMTAGRAIITDEQRLPDKWWRTKREPDKQAIRVALKEGETIPGAELSNASPTLRIRT
jgi:hypothetical protein